MHEHPSQQSTAESRVKSKAFTNAASWLCTEAKWVAACPSPLTAATGTFTKPLAVSASHLFLLE
jgi:hypothetical protein